MLLGAMLLKTTGLDGATHDFQFEVEHDPLFDRAWFYRVYSLPRDPNRYYVAKFRLVDRDTLRSEMLDRMNNDEFAGMGIAEALFAQVVLDLGKRLVSSSNKADDGQFRTVKA